MTMLRATLMAKQLLHAILPLERFRLAGLKKPGEKQFQRMFVNQVEKAKNSILDKVTKEICCSSYHNIIFTCDLHGKPIFRQQQEKC